MWIEQNLAKIVEFDSKIKLINGQYLYNTVILLETLLFQQKKQGNYFHILLLIQFVNYLKINIKFHC